MKMAAALPDYKSGRNGLDDLAKNMVGDPEREMLCIVLVDCSQILLDVDRASRTPTIRVKHLEPMLLEDDQRVALGLLTDAYKRRTSEQLELEYEFETIHRDAPAHFPPVV